MRPMKTKGLRDGARTAPSQIIMNGQVVRQTPRHSRPQRYSMSPPPSRVIQAGDLLQEEAEGCVPSPQREPRSVPHGEMSLVPALEAGLEMAGGGGPPHRLAG